MNNYDGKWAISGCEERWDFAETYDTRDEAEDNVPNYCEEYDYTAVFVGQARRLTYDGLVDYGDVATIVENMNTCAYDNSGAEEDVVELSDAQMEGLRLHVVDWMARHLDPINWYVVENMECVTP